VTETSCRDELLNGEIVYSLREAQIVIEQWRRHYNTIRPQLSLGVNRRRVSEMSAAHVVLAAPCTKEINFVGLEGRDRCQLARTPALEVVRNPILIKPLACNFVNGFPTR